VLPKLKDGFLKIKGNLTSLDDQPLSKAALIIILFLDLFILISIFNGLGEHTRQLAAPDDFIPYSCREVVINREWNPSNRTENLSNIIISHNSNYYLPPERKKNHHPICEPYLALFDQIKSDKELAAVFEERQKFAREANELQRGISAEKGAYDTSLLETIAKEKEGRANVDRIKKDVQVKTESLNTLRGQIVALELEINSNPTVRLLWERLNNQDRSAREQLRADLRKAYFWYPLQRLGMQILFLLPLFIIFYIWNNASVRKNRGIQALVSAHLLVISFIPIFCKIVETIYDILPKKLLRKLIELLESLKLIAIWHYLMIALAVAAALFCIYIFQRKIFSREKLLERRIMKGQCQQCGKQLPKGSQACSFCGFSQYKPCTSCDKPTFVFGKHCSHCGKAQ
jgi:hypothetical protein